MNRPRNRNLLSNARSLQKNMTKEERKLWFGFLRSYPVRFRRQEIIGNYIVDFYCSKAALIVELDGSQHYEADGEDYDKKRTAYLNQFSLAVMRYSNLDVINSFAGVCESIDAAVKRRTPQSPLVTAPLPGEPEIPSLKENVFANDESDELSQQGEVFQ